MSDTKATDFLILNKNKNESRSLAKMIENFGLNVVACLSDSQSVIDIVKEKKIDVALIDIGLKDDIDGIKCAHILKNNFNIKIIILSNNEDRSTEILDLEPESFHIKPFKRIHLKIAIRLMESKFDRNMKVIKR